VRQADFGRFAVSMLQDALSAYESGDDQKAEEVWRRDKELDEMYTAHFRELMMRMIEDPARISVNTQLLFMARGIERVGDRATNIAENVQYLVRGTLPEEDRPKGDATRAILLRKPS
jgi:phosphate transport system protein